MVHQQCYSVMLSIVFETKKKEDWIVGSTKFTRSSINNGIYRKGVSNTFAPLSAHGLQIIREFNNLMKIEQKSPSSCLYLVRFSLARLKSFLGHNKWVYWRSVKLFRRCWWWRWCLHCRCGQLDLSFNIIFIISRKQLTTNKLKLYRLHASEIPRLCTEFTFQRKVNSISLIVVRAKCLLCLIAGALKPLFANLQPQQSPVLSASLIISPLHIVANTTPVLPETTSNGLVVTDTIHFTLDPNSSSPCGERGSDASTGPSDTQPSCATQPRSQSFTADSQCAEADKLLSELVSPPPTSRSSQLLTASPEVSLKAALHCEGVAGTVDPFAPTDRGSAVAELRTKQVFLPTKKRLLGEIKTLLSNIMKQNMAAPLKRVKRCLPTTDLYLSVLSSMSPLLLSN